MGYIEIVWTDFQKFSHKKQKIEHGYLNSKLFLYQSTFRLSCHSWNLTSEKRHLYQDNRLKPESPMSCGPNLAHHQFLYICELKVVFTFFNGYKIQEYFMACEIQMSMPINKVLLEHGNLDHQHKSIIHIYPDSANLKGKTLGRKSWVEALKGYFTGRS